MSLDATYNVLTVVRDLGFFHFGACAAGQRNVVRESPVISRAIEWALSRMVIDNQLRNDETWLSPKCNDCKVFFVGETTVISHAIEWNSIGDGIAKPIERTAKSGLSPECNDRMVLA